MTDAGTGDDGCATGSGGVPWSDRGLIGGGFEGDLGAADTFLLPALDDPGDEIALMTAVARARLLVPIVVRPPEVEDGAKAPTGRSTDMAVVTLTAPDGQRAFPVFSSLATILAWDPAARPCPVTSSRAGQRAVTEGCDVMLLDCASPHECVLRPSMVWALAQQRVWLPAHTDPFVARALARATANEDDVIDITGQAAGAGNLRVVLSLRAGLEAVQVQALATAIGERIATDGEARARIDGLSFTVAQA